jgi:Zn-dependent peptidase ImmA (M78 family)
MLNALVLRTAREALGLTQKDFADNSGFTQAEVSRWEKALREPTVEQIHRLAAAAQVPVVTLTSDKRIGQPIHRSQKKELKRVTRRADARLELARLALDELVASVDLGPPPFSFPDSEDALASDPEVAATVVRRVWGVGSGPFPALGEIIEAAGGIVAPVDMGTHDILAAYSRIRTGQRWFWINDRVTDNARLRFSLAHELGHAMLHWDRFAEPVPADAEKEAHWFASALLMPRDEIRRTLLHVRPTISELTSVARQWMVSVQALIMRARQVEAISPAENTRLWRQLNSRGLARAQLVDVPADAPSVLNSILEVHRTKHGYSEDEIATICQLPLARLRDLLPSLFPSPRAGDGRPPLRVVRVAD